MQFQAAHRGIWTRGKRCPWDLFCAAFCQNALIPYSSLSGTCTALIRIFASSGVAPQSPALLDALPLADATDAMSDVASSAGDQSIVAAIDVSVQSTLDPLLAYLAQPGKEVFQLVSDDAPFLKCLACKSFLNAKTFKRIKYVVQHESTDKHRAALARTLPHCSPGCWKYGGSPTR